MLEVFAVDELHHKKRGASVSVRVIHAHDVGVLKSSCGMCFSSKSRLVRVGVFLGQVFNFDGFDGNTAIEVWINPFKNASHCAAAQHAQHVVAAQLRNLLRHKTPPAGGRDSTKCVLCNKSIMQS